MNNGRYVTYIGKKKSKKLLKVLCITAAVIFVLISVLGILFGSGSAEKEQIYTAVNENAELKKEIARLNSQIEDLEEQLAQEKEKKVEEDEYSPLFRSPSPTPASGIAPRDIAQ